MHLRRLPPDNKIEDNDSGREAPMAKRILIVEDNEDNRFILVQILRFSGYETIEAITGIDGVEQALGEKPDLIFMDLGLPRLDGLDAARAILTNPITAQIPIIAHTAWNPEQFKAQALQVGMVDYLQKPVPITLLKATIERFLKLN